MNLLIHPGGRNMANMNSCEKKCCKEIEESNRLELIIIPGKVFFWMGGYESQ